MTKPDPSRTHDDEEPLAQAIRRGIDRRPDQAFGEYYHGHGASCALGAAYEGLYRLPFEVQGIVAKDLWRYYECLDFVIRRCPDDCHKQLPLGALIVHLNDDHRWSRERIADWVASLAPSSVPIPTSSDDQGAR
jgi:hypothetical protein